MIRNCRKWVLAGTLAVLGGWVFDSRPAHAQMNTYADVPFNQGSLFYRPSGARPPATTSYPRPAQAPAYQYNVAPQGATTYYYPTTGTSYYYPQYQYPGTGTYYYPQYQYRQRRGLFGLFR